MLDAAPARVEEILNSFTELISKLLIDQYQQQIADLDLTLSQAQVLKILRRGPITTGQLATQLRISAPAITQLTDRLIRKELIERRAATGDRRCVLVALSDKGRKLVDQFRQSRRDIFNEALTHLSDDEQAQVIEVLGKVVRALESYETNLAVKRNVVGDSVGKKQKRAVVI